MSALGPRGGGGATTPTAPLSVGHKGAAALAEGNTSASFEAALDAGVDMIEFDVLRGVGGQLVLAHDPEDAAGRVPLTLEQGLDLLASPRYGETQLDVDVKHPGFEPELAAALIERGLEGRTLVSSTYPVTLRRFGELLPGVPRGLSVPRARRDHLQTPWARPAALLFMALVRARLPRRVARLLRAGEIEAVMAHSLLVTPRLLSAVRGAGGRLFVWTVDDAREVTALAALGVDGIISNDPRLVRPLGASGAAVTPDVPR